MTIWQPQMAYKSLKHLCLYFPILGNQRRGVPARPRLYSLTQSLDWLFWFACRVRRPCKVVCCICFLIVGTFPWHGSFYGIYGPATVPILLDLIN